MKIQQAIEQEDGTVVFQGILEGLELAYVIEIGLETIISGNVAPFLHTKSYEPCEIYRNPTETQ